MEKRKPIPAFVFGAGIRFPPRGVRTGPRRCRRLLKQSMKRSRMREPRTFSGMQWTKNNICDIIFFAYLISVCSAGSADSGKAGNSLCRERNNRQGVTRNMKKARISFIILVLMSIVLCTALPGLAEKEAKVYDWLQMGQISDAVYDVQAALTKLKYFPEGVKVNFSVYDEATEKAVQLFCEENNIEREPGKISPDLQRFLLESSLSARVTPDTGKEPQGYDWLFYGRSSDAVTEVQKKLADLNYFDEDASYKMGVFDKATADAMRLFCKVNHIEFPSEGISPDIQKFMLEGSPKPRPTPTPSPVPTPTEVPTPTPFPNYTIGAYDGEVIAGVQKRLKILKYFEGLEGSMMFGEYDDVTEEAVKRFCEVQGIMYMPEKGLTKELYGFIMASDAP